MKKDIRTLLLICFYIIGNTFVCNAQIFGNFALPVKLWIIGNENKAMSALNVDKQIIERLQTPFMFEPIVDFKFMGSNTKLWHSHYKFYRLLNQTVEIYDIAKKYGNGKFAVMLKRARPCEWALYPFLFINKRLKLVIALNFRKGFHNDLLKVLKLDAERDVDLSMRLKNEIKKLNDDEYRTFKLYLAYFSALYPTSNSAKMVASLIKLAETRQFAKQIVEVLKPAGVMVKPVESTGKAEEDPLAKLSKLAESDNEIPAASATIKNDNVTDPFIEITQNGEKEDMFNILE